MYTNNIANIDSLVKLSSRAKRVIVGDGYATVINGSIENIDISPTQANSLRDFAEMSGWSVYDLQSCPGFMVTPGNSWGTEEIPFNGEPVAPEPISDADCYGLEPRF